MAQVAVRLHALDLAAPPFDRSADSWIAPLDELRTPRGARRPAVWAAAFRALAAPPPLGPDAFLHGDFLPVNLLWSRGRIGGITDWNSVHRSPAAVDGSSTTAPNRPPCCGPAATMPRTVGGSP